MTTTNFIATATVSNNKILPTAVRAEGVTIMDAIVALRAKLGKFGTVSVSATEIKMVMFGRGGFRFVAPVSRRTLRKYKNDRGAFLAPLNIN